MKNKPIFTYKLCYLLVCICTLGILISCNKHYSKESIAGNGAVAEMAITESAVAHEPIASEEQVPTVERKLIKEGMLVFETSDLEATKKQLAQAIKKHQGYVASENENNTSSRLNHTLVIRVPAKYFDAFIQDATQGVDRFDTKDIHVKDVTAEFIDVEARLKTKKELEQRYLDLLKKANKVAEILDIEKQIGELRSDIEATEGQLRYLTNQASYSTVNITYYKSIPTQTAFGNKFKNGFFSGWDHFVWFLVGLVNMWPFLLIAALLVYLFKRWRQGRKKENEVQH